MFNSNSTNLVKLKLIKIWVIEFWKKYILKCTFKNYKYVFEKEGFGEWWHRDRSKIHWPRIWTECWRLDAILPYPIRPLETSCPPYLKHVETAIFEAKSHVTWILPGYGFVCDFFLKYSNSCLKLQLTTTIYYLALNKYYYSI